MDVVLIPYQGIQGVKGINDFIKRFFRWRICCLRLAVFAMIFVTALDMYDAYNKVKTVQKSLLSIPPILKDKIEPFMKANAYGEVVVAVAILIAFSYAVRGWRSNGDDYPYSLEMTTKAWLIYFFAPFCLFIVVPFAAAFPDDAMRRDICAITLASVMHLGPQFRAAWVVSAQSEPGLAKMALHSPPELDEDMEAIKQWSGYKWCDENKWEWEEKVFSSRWLALSTMGVGKPTIKQIGKARSVVQVHQGIVPPALINMALMMAIPMDSEFMLCCDDLKSLLQDAKQGVYGSESANHLAIGAPQQSAHTAALTQMHDGNGLNVSAVHARRQSGHALKKDRVVAVGADGGVFDVNGAATGPADKDSREHSTQKTNLHDHHALLRDEVVEVDADGHVSPIHLAASSPQESDDNTNLEEKLSSNADEARLQSIELHGLSSVQLPGVQTSSRIMRQEGAASKVMRRAGADDESLEGEDTGELVRIQDEIQDELRRREGADDGKHEISLKSAGVSLLRADANQSAAIQSLDMPDIPNPMAAPLSTICNMYVSALGFLRSSTMARESIRGFLGFYTSLNAFKTLFPAMFGVINGISSAVENVKMVLPNASSPGYILMIAVLAFLPAFMLLMALGSQVMGQITMGMAFFMLTLSIVATGYKGYLMTMADNEKSVKKNFKAADSKIKKAKALTALLLICWVVYKVYTMNQAGIRELKDMFQNISLDQLKEDAPVIGGQILVNFLMFRNLTLVVFTDLLMVAVFDAADDELDAKESGTMDEDKSALLHDWHTIYPKKGNGKKHKHHQHSEYDGQKHSQGKKSKKDKKSGKQFAKERDAALQGDWYSQGVNAPSAAQHGHFPASY